MIELAAYITKTGVSPFRRWRSLLDPPVRSRVTYTIQRLAEGNFSSVKGVGHGVYELRIDFGPGYRVYFGKSGNTLVVLLAGGTKRRQQNDIEEAHTAWQDYRVRRKVEPWP